MDLSKYYLAATFIILILIVPMGIIFSGKREIKINLTDTDFRIKSVYGLTIAYSDIKSLDTISSLPRIRLRTKGYSFGKTLKGNFTLDDRTRVKLFVTKRNPPYILLRTNDVNLYLNFKKNNQTKDLFKALTTRVGGES